MRKLFIFLTAALLLSASTAWAQASYTLVRTATSTPSDADPNTTPPPAGEQFTIPTHCAAGYACTGYEFVWVVPTAIAALRCDARTWVWDSTLSLWYFGTLVSATERWERVNEPVSDRVTVWAQLDCSGAVVDSTNTLRLVVRGL